MICCCHCQTHLWDPLPCQCLLLQAHITGHQILHRWHQNINWALTDNSEEWKAHLQTTTCVTGNSMKSTLFYSTNPFNWSWDFQWETKRKWELSLLACVPPPVPGPLPLSRRQPGPLAPISATLWNVTCYKYDTWWGHKVKNWCQISLKFQLPDTLGGYCTCISGT